MAKRYFLVLALTLAALIGVIVVFGTGLLVDLLVLIDLPSLGLVVALAALMGFAAHSPREVGRSYRLAFSGRGGSREELEQAATYFDGLMRYLACGGAIGALMGFVEMLRTIGDMASVGRGLATCLLSALYAVLLIAVVGVPFRTAIRKRLAGLAG